MNASQNYRAVVCIRLIGYAGQAGISDENDLQRKCAERLLVIGDIAARRGGELHQQNENRLIISFSYADTALETLVEIFNRNRGSGIPYSAGIAYGPADINDNEVSGLAAERSIHLLEKTFTAKITVDNAFVHSLSGKLHQFVHQSGMHLEGNDNERITLFDLNWSQVSGLDKSAQDEVSSTAQESPDVEVSREEPSTSCKSRKTKLILELSKQRICLSDAGERLTIGRSKHCDIVIKSAAASRQHAVVELTENGFQLTDKSKNGTYLSSKSGKIKPVRGTSTILSGKGLIYIGRPPEDANSVALNYTIKTAVT